MLNIKFVNIMCLYCSTNLVSTKYVFPCDIVGKRIYKVVMYLKHVRCDKTWNYIAYEKLKVHLVLPPTRL